MKPLVTFVKDVLLDAIKAEMEARAFLIALAERAGAPAVRQKLLTLAEREIVHRAHLERRLREETGEAAPAVESPEVSIAPEVKNLTMTRALKIVLERERESESKYRFLAERVQDPELIQLFLELAELEWKHKVEIQAEYDNSSSDPENFLDEM
ncbi:MAG: ferritin family protein [Thermoanaerobaculia bacterium]